MRILVLLIGLVFANYSFRSDYSYDFLLLATQWRPTQCLTRNCPSNFDITGFGIHGLWPSYSSGNYGPEYCPNSNPFQISSSIEEKMMKYWTSYSSSDPTSFWEHEWSKHGVCVKQGETCDSFFSTTLNIFLNLDPQGKLANQGIYPGDKPVEKKDFFDAFDEYIDIECSTYEGKSYLSTLNACFDKSYNWIDCSTSSTNCPDSFYLDTAEFKFLLEMKKIGNYNLEEELGRGKFGVVYLARNRNSDEIFAAKVIPIKLMRNKILEQLESEMYVLKSIKSPYIAKFHQIMRSQTNIYEIIEYCGGGDLADYIRINGKVEEELGRKWLSQLISAFISLEEIRAMHRDLKSSNVLLTQNSPEGDIRLADFGFARFLNEESLAVTELGTPLYMAPEIFENKEYSYKADVWSLGVLSYEILTGEMPFKARILQELKLLQEEPIEFPESVDLSENARNLIRWMLSYEEERRPSFEELLTHPFFEEVKIDGLVEEKKEFVIDENEYEDLKEEEIKIENECEEEEESFDLEEELCSILEIEKLYDWFEEENNYFGALGVAIYSKEKLNEILFNTENYKQSFEFEEQRQKIEEKLQEIEQKINEAIHNSDIPTEGEINKELKEMIAESILEFCLNQIEFGENPAFPSIQKSFNLLLVAHYLKPQDLEIAQAKQEAYEEFKRFKIQQQSIN